MPSQEHLEGSVISAILLAISGFCIKAFTVWKNSKKGDVEVKGEEQQLQHKNTDFIINKYEKLIEKLEFNQNKTSIFIEKAEEDHKKCREERLDLIYRLEHAEKEIISLRKDIK